MENKHSQLISELSDAGMVHVRISAYVFKVYVHDSLTFYFNQKYFSMY